MATVTRLYDDYAKAQQAVRSLEAAGIPSSDISIAASNSDGWYDKTIDRDRDGTDDRAEGAATGAGIGATVGGAAGVLTGLGLMAIPGVGPIVAAGWLASLAAGAVAGGATGGIIGALTQAGVSEDEANVYAEGLRRGGSIVTVRTNDSSTARVESLLDSSAVNWRTRSDSWRKEGWNRYDPAASPYTSDQVRAERSRYIGQ
ncbi:hypothetical protein PY365_29240 [Roseiarcaceae bacterium H3SJ34-1]|uniref:hypothetical protein n=1 Tax=Terripilifer ovatus TaxID=3032367 RepID=UPI003AB93276|nr:hypothetical protein [Roseiarcaceae bacterium H3SJ34-1]